MKNIVTLFPDEILKIISQARFDEKRNSVSEFVREAVKTYLFNSGYELPETEEIIKRGPQPGWQKISNTNSSNLKEAIEEYVAPKEPTAAWGETPKWGE